MKTRTIYVASRPDADSYAQAIRELGGSVVAVGMQVRSSQSGCAGTAEVVGSSAHLDPTRLAPVVGVDARSGRPVRLHLVTTSWGVGW
ncbi:hypothetical protein ACPPVW_18565 [Leifsonia sp. McL0607]|uniref:hypothetical protein n=1 Tax=Leifsonia sp. McL0607 TaxID=3415672 RepID=UPI003CF03A9E